jgi:hypothetical protein
MKKTTIIISIIAGIFLIIGGIFVLGMSRHSKYDLFMVGFAAILSGTYLLYKPLFVSRKFNPAGTSPTLVKKFELIIITTTVIVYLYLLAQHFPNIDMRQNGQTNSGFYIGIFAIIVLLIGVCIAWARKKKMTVYDYFTLKAKDEREQQLIDQAGRKAYALMRFLLPVLGIIIIISGSFVNFASFSVNKVFVLLITLSIIGELFFRFFTRSIET